MPISEIAIVNKSTLLSDANGQIIVSALNMVLPKFCSDWNIPTVVAVYVPINRPTNVSIKIYLLDNSDVENALGYHDEINNIPYGKCFVNTVLQNKGALLWNENPRVQTFAQTVCHEIFEMIVDLYCNIWAMLADKSTLYAYEVCDPVESNALTVSVQTVTSTVTKSRVPPFKNITTTSVTYTNVGLSDWVLPEWFNPHATKGPFNHLNTLRAPFTLSPNGYVISLTNGTVKTVFGDNVTEKSKEIILKKERLAKRT